MRLVGARSGATMTLPYEPGRPAFAALGGARSGGWPTRSGTHGRRASCRRRPARAPAPLGGPGSAACSSGTRRRPRRPRGRRRALVLEAAGALRRGGAGAGRRAAAGLRTGVAPGEILIVTANDPVGRSEIGDALRVGLRRAAARRGTPAAAAGGTPLGAALVLRAAGGVGSRAGARRPVRVPALALVGAVAPARGPGRGAGARARHHGGAEAIEAACLREPGHPARLGLVRLPGAPTTSWRLVTATVRRDARLRARAQPPPKRAGGRARGRRRRGRQRRAGGARRRSATRRSIRHRDARRCAGRCSGFAPPCGPGRPRPGCAGAAPAGPRARAACRPRSWSWPGWRTRATAPGGEDALSPRGLRCGRAARPPDAPDLARHRRLHGRHPRPRLASSSSPAVPKTTTAASCRPRTTSNDLVRALGQRATAPQQPRAR